MKKIWLGSMDAFCFRRVFHADEYYFWAVWGGENICCSKHLQMFQMYVSALLQTLCLLSLIQNTSQPGSYSRAPAWIMNGASKFKHWTLCSQGPVIAGMLAPVVQYGTDSCKRSAALAQNRPFRVRKSRKGGNEGWRRLVASERADDRQMEEWGAGFLL